LAVIEKLGDGLNLEENFLIPTFVPEFIEVLMHEGFCRGNSFDWGVLHDLGDKVDEKRISGLQQLVLLK
jgi:hypothetical protein